MALPPASAAALLLFVASAVVAAIAAVRWEPAMRWLGESMERRRAYLLLLVCCFMLGSSALYDAPSAMSRPLRESLDLTFDEFRFVFGALFTAYGLPNVVLPMYVGALVRRHGQSVVIGGAVLLVLVAGLMQVVGVGWKSAALLIAGRFVLGSGSESLLILQSSLISTHWDPQRLALGLSIVLSAQRLTSVADFSLMPVAADALGLDVVCWIIVGVALISVAATYAYREAERRWGMALPGQIDGALPNSKLSPVMERGLRLQEYAQAMAGASPVAMPLGNVISGNIINESELGHSDDKMLMDDGESVSMMQRAASTRRLPMFDGDAMHGAELDLERRELRPRRPSTMLTRTLARLLPTDTFHFPRAYWVLVVILNCVTTSTVSFLPMAPAYFEARYFPGDAVTAATYVSLPDTISGVMLPIVGYLACRGTRGKELTSPTATTSSSLHRKAVQIVASALSVLMAHLLFAYGGHNSSIVWPLIAFGCGYTLYSSVIYSLMSELVLLDDRGRRRRSSEGGTHGATASDTSGLVATAYGVAATTLNITSVIVPMLVAELLGGGSSDGELLSEDAESPSSETHASAHTLHTRIPASAFASMQSFYVAVAAVGVVAALFLEHALRRNQPRTG